MPCVLEQLLPLAAELSVIVVRGADGSIVNFPVQQNLHRDGIPPSPRCPQTASMPPLQQQAVASARQVAEAMGYVGVLCIEFFLLQDGRLVVNEMAPRPHNSSHYTLDGCDVSQFEMQVRAMAGLPLVAPRLVQASVMLNLLGDLWFRGGEGPQTPDWAAVLACQARICTCMARPRPARGARWATST